MLDCYRVAGMVLDQTLLLLASSSIACCTETLSDLAIACRAVWLIEVAMAIGYISQDSYYWPWTAATALPVVVTLGAAAPAKASVYAACALRELAHAAELQQAESALSGMISLLQTHK